MLPHKKALEKLLQERLGELFDLDYDLLLYDITSTYFEGQAEGNPQAQRGYSRDHRPDCKQVNIALVVSRCGMPLGYEVFAGNRHDATTLEEIVPHMEELYGRAGRVWVMDRGLASEKNVRFLRDGGRRYILGTAKNSLRKFEQELLSEDWKHVHEGLEVRLVPAPDGEEVLILCRSAERQAKEQAMHERFEKRIAEGFLKIAASCDKRRQPSGVVERRVGRLLERNSRAARLFDVRVEVNAQGFTQLRWTKVESLREWARRSEGCYLLRSNVTEWTPEELWRAYVQLTQAEAAFRVHKSDLQIRPLWHHREHRVNAHILVCFLAYVLWKTLSASCRQAGLGDEPRQVFEELSEIALVDVVLPTRHGVEVRKRCIGQPTEHQRILLQRLGMRLPTALEKAQMQWKPSGTHIDSKDFIHTTAEVGLSFACFRLAARISVLPSSVKRNVATRRPVRSRPRLSFGSFASVSSAAASLSRSISTSPSFASRRASENTLCRVQHLLFTTSTVVIGPSQ